MTIALMVLGIAGGRIEITPEPILGSLGDEPMELLVKRALSM